MKQMPFVMVLVQSGPVNCNRIEHLGLVEMRADCTLLPPKNLNSPNPTVVTIVF